MPIGDVVMNADIAYKPDLFHDGGENNMNDKEFTCNMPVVPEVGYPWIPVPPPMPCPHPWPYPPAPWPPHPAPEPTPEPEPEQDSVSKQICKLSRKANVITKMLENLENKKDVIINVGGYSYNFGNIDLVLTDWADGNYANTVKRMLEFELSLIKTKIAELAEELGEEAVLNPTTETTVGG